MKQRLFMLAIMSLNLLAADLTGKWNGTASHTEEGQKINHPLSVKLTQNGTTVTGATFTEGGQSLPLEGVVQDGRVTLKLTTSSELIVFELKMEGSHLKGTLTSQHGAESQTSTVDLTRSES